MFALDRMGLRNHTDDVVMWVRGWDLAGSREGDWTRGCPVGGLSGLRAVNSTLREWAQG